MNQLRPHERLALTLAKNFTRRCKSVEFAVATVLIETVERLASDEPDGSEVAARAIQSDLPE
jgi:hypothetical protein